MTRSRRNNIKARKYFGIYGDNNLVLHHTDITLKTTNYERYIEWNPEDLVVVTRSEHMLLHQELDPEFSERLSKNGKLNKGRHHTEEAKQKMSKNHWDCSGANNPQYGKHREFGDEWRLKLAQSKQNRHWYNNGINEVWCETCPDGFNIGRLKKGEKIC